jgi:predicted LPLAT superfamily acyltransferase
MGIPPVHDVAPPPPTLRCPQPWVTQPERGSDQLLRAMSALSLRCGRKLSRVVLFLVVIYYWLRPGEAAVHIARFQSRALARRPTRRDLFSQLLAFATCIHDRVYLLRDRFEDFAVEVINEHLLLRALQQGSGCFLMGAHVGSFEVLRSLGRQHPGVKVAMAMYAEHSRKLGTLFASINPSAVADIIPLGSVDAMLRVRAQLEQGAFVGLLGDRTLADEPVVHAPFLGAPAVFPTGPWRAAALLRRPVLLIVGVYCGGNRYRIIVEQLADFTCTEPAARGSQIREAIVRYASRLEIICRSHPYNWFNFFDFWHEQSGPPAP